MLTSAALGFWFNIYDMSEYGEVNPNVVEFGWGDSGWGWKDAMSLYILVRRIHGLLDLPGQWLTTTLLFTFLKSDWQYAVSLPFV